MRAVVIEQFGGPEQLKLETLPDPVPGPDEVQIKVAYAGVNPIDWKIVAGLVQQRIPHQFPIILGWDAAGIISALGDEVDNFKLGDKVYCYCRKEKVHDGSYAEYVCYRAKDVALMPTNLSFAQAAAFPLASLTAWQVLSKIELKKGETILIQAGAGGVGSLAIQFAKIMGAFVITTARQSNHSYVKQLGAAIAIDYQTQNLKDEILKIAPQGVDALFDTVGGETLKNSYSLVKPGGRLVSIVQPPDQALGDQFKIKTLYHFASPSGQDLKQIAELIQTGKIKPIPIQELPLEKAAEALEINLQRHLQGKLVLKVQDV